MYKITRILIAVLLMITLSFSTACQSPAESSLASTNPIHITDHLGRTIILESPPQRIISGYYIATSMLIALDLENQIVGVEDKPAKRPIYKLSAPRLLDLPTVGSAKEFNLEAALALKPDLVVLSVRQKETIDTLESLNIKVIGINPESSKLLAEAITMVGQATDHTDRAAELNQYCADLAQKAEQAIEDQPTQRLYLAGNSDVLSTAGSKMYQSNLLTNAGATNVAEDLTDAYWSQISYEQLLAWQPEKIILASDAAYTLESVASDPALAELSAVASGSVYQIPNQLEAWDSPIPAGILGQLYITQLLYPDLYSSNDFSLDVNAFYQKFYDTDVSYSS